MMKKILSFLFVIVFFVIVDAQKKDSIFISAEFTQHNSLKIKQRIVYHNPLSKTISVIKLLNWTAAYQNKQTPLARRKLEERKVDIYFAKNQGFGRVSDLEISSKEVNFIDVDARKENIYFPLSIPLKQGESIEIDLSYTIHFPDASFTGYGKLGEDFNLKYFFLVPDGFEDEKQSPKYYLDLEETQNTDSYWDINFKVSGEYFIQSNLTEGKDRFSFQGEPKTDVEFYLSKREFKILSPKIDNEEIKVILVYPIENGHLESLEFYLPLHLKYIKEKIGFLPKKILVSPKEREEKSFLGNEDIKLRNRRLPLFTIAEKIDLDYFNLISQNILKIAFLYNKNTDHWLKNGLKTYLEIQYLKKFYKDHPLLGNFKDISFLGVRILKWSNVSKLKLIDRYGVAYQYAKSQNTDQAIGTNFDQLRDYNQFVISQFEIGTLLDFVSEKEGSNEFDSFIKSYIFKNRGKRIVPTGFLEDLSARFGNSYDFIKDFIDKKQRIDFSLKSVNQIKEGIYEFKVGKNTLQNIPFKLEVKNTEGKEQIFWLDTKKGQLESSYQLAIEDPARLVINPNYSFPEVNLRNNFFEKRWFGFSKKVKFRLLTDIPNPEYNEVYINPDLRYNAYDALLLGVNFRNSGLLSYPFSYSITPYISLGEWKITGAAGASYKIQPTNTFFRTLVLGASGTYFHYDYDLSYRKITLFSTLYFQQKPRSLIDKSVRISYQYIDRDLSAYTDTIKNYAYYGLWNFAFHIEDKHPIHEKIFTTNFQLMRDFQKLSLEGIYYWQFAPKKFMQFRAYGGLFLKNNAKNRAFDFGISKINDYNFAYSLLGQSAVSGLFAQEYIMAEGGFKSYVGSNANQWILALNVDIPIWKKLGVYVDIGGYKNKSLSPHFIWDSGVKIGLIPSILEIYFPLQSSLGFEPTLKNYHGRIRFSLNLDLNSLMRAIRIRK